MTNLSPADAQIKEGIDGLVLLINFIKQYGGWAIAAFLLFLIIFKTENVLLLSGAVLRFAGRVYRPLKKKGVERAIRGNLSRATKEIASVGIDDLFPLDLSIELIEHQERDAFIQSNKVIVRMSDSQNQEKNYVIAASEYVKKGFLPNAKRCFSDNLRTASDIVMLRKIIEKTRNIGLDYFCSEFYADYIQRDARIDVLYTDLLKVDDNGMFLSVLARQASLHYKDARFIETNSAIRDDFRNLATMLTAIARKQPHPNVQRLLIGSYLKIGFVFAVRIDTKIEIENVVGEVIGWLEKGVESIYILALGRKISAANEIAKRAHEIDMRILREPLVSTYRKSSGGGWRTFGVCIELTTIPLGMQTEDLEGKSVSA